MTLPKSAQKQSDSCSKSCLATPGSGTCPMTWPCRRCRCRCFVPSDACRLHRLLLVRRILERTMAGRCALPCCFVCVRASSQHSRLFQKILAQMEALLRLWTAHGYVHLTWAKMPRQHGVQSPHSSEMTRAC